MLYSFLKDYYFQATRRERVFRRKYVNNQTMNLLIWETLQFFICLCGKCLLSINLLVHTAFSFL